MIQFLRIDFNTGKIQKRKEKQGVCVEYDTEKINDTEYLRSVIKQVLFVYENRKPVKIEYTPAKTEKKVYHRDNTAPAMEYTPRAVVGIIKRNENTEKQMSIISLLLK